MCDSRVRTGRVWHGHGRLWVVGKLHVAEGDDTIMKPCFLMEVALESAPSILFSYIHFIFSSIPPLSVITWYAIGVWSHTVVFMYRSDMLTLIIWTCLWNRHRNRCRRHWAIRGGMKRRSGRNGWGHRSFLSKTMRNSNIPVKYSNCHSNKIET